MPVDEGTDQVHAVRRSELALELHAHRGLARLVDEERAFGQRHEGRFPAWAAGRAQFPEEPRSVRRRVFRTPVGLPHLPVQRLEGCSSRRAELANLCFVLTARQRREESLRYRRQVPGQDMGRALGGQVLQPGLQVAGELRQGCLETVRQETVVEADRQSDAAVGRHGSESSVRTQA